MTEEKALAYYLEYLVGEVLNLGHSMAEILASQVDFSSQRTMESGLRDLQEYWRGRAEHSRVARMYSNLPLYGSIEPFSSFLWFSFPNPQYYFNIMQMLWDLGPGPIADLINQAMATPV